MKWNINRISFPIYNLGPGKRIGIWVNGCSIRCKDCISKELWNFSKGKKVEISNIYVLIHILKKFFNGITITGGEPFDQYKQLITFCYFVKKYSKLDILCYTGYYLNELEKKYPDKTFYKYIDYIIDGPYIKEKHCNDSFKGSHNQNIWKIEKRNIYKIEFMRTKKWSLNFEKNKLHMVGIPPINLIENIEKILNKNYISLK